MPMHHHLIDAIVCVDLNQLRLIRLPARSECVRASRIDQFFFTVIR